MFHYYYPFNIHTSFVKYIIEEKRVPTKNA
jgi:hypothetical protein